MKNDQIEHRFKQIVEEGINNLTNERLAPINNIEQLIELPLGSKLLLKDRHSSFESAYEYHGIVTKDAYGRTDGSQQVEGLTPSDVCVRIHVSQLNNETYQRIYSKLSYYYRPVDLGINNPNIGLYHITHSPPEQVINYIVKELMGEMFYIKLDERK